MDEKIAWFLAFAVLLLAMIFGSRQIEKHLIDGAEEQLKIMPKWKVLIISLLEHYPQHLLTNTGKKWRLLVYILLVPTILVSMKLAQFISG